MSLPSWAPIVASLIGGGFAGALLNAAVTRRRNRIQPVGKSIEIIPIFKDHELISSLIPKITVSDGEKEYNYDNLHIAQIQLVNRGNQDFEKFTFGMTLSDDDQAIYIQFQTKDRHHNATLLNDITFENPSSEFDIELIPFNRKESYNFDLYIVAQQTESAPSELSFSTPHPVKFVDLPQTSEIIDMLSEVSSPWGLITFTMKRLLKILTY